jgi:hypothetical protein
MSQSLPPINGPLTDRQLALILSVHHEGGHNAPTVDDECVARARTYLAFLTEDAAPGTALVTTDQPDKKGKS